MRVCWATSNRIYGMSVIEIKFEKSHKCSNETRKKNAPRTQEIQNKTNINCLTGEHKWKSMDAQIFGRFINLLFAFSSCVYVFFFSFVRHSTIYGFDIWKFQSSKKYAFSGWKKGPHYICKNMRFYLLFIILDAYRFTNIFHLKCWRVFIYLFCAFSRFQAWWLKSDNVYSNI